MNHDEAVRLIGEALGRCTCQHDSDGSASPTLLKAHRALTVLKQRPQGVEAAAKEIAEMIGECSFDEWSQDDVADIIARHTQPTNLERQYGKPLCLKHYYLCPDEDCNKQGTHVRYDVTAEQEKEK